MSIERINDIEVRVVMPLTDEDVAQLKIGDHVRITGTIYTARDAAHNRLIQMLDAGGEMPIDVRGQLIYYTGPTPARPGRPIGAMGPTTAMRMDPFTPRLLEAGLKATMGRVTAGPKSGRPSSRTGQSSSPPSVAPERCFHSSSRRSKSSPTKTWGRSRSSE